MAICIVSRPITYSCSSLNVHQGGVLKSSKCMNCTDWWFYIQINFKFYISWIMPLPIEIQWSEVSLLFMIFFLAFCDAFHVMNHVLFHEKIELKKNVSLSRFKKHICRVLLLKIAFSIIWIFDKICIAPHRHRVKLTVNDICWWLIAL